MQKSIKVVLDIYAPAFAVSEILTFEIFDHEKVGQGKWSITCAMAPSMANIKIAHFCPSSHCFRDVNI